MKFISNKRQKIRDLLRDNGVSYKTLSLLKKHGQTIFVCEKEKKLSDYTDSGEVVQIFLPEKNFLPVEKKDLGVKIIYEDEDIIIIFKPKGIASTPSKSHFNNSISSNLNLIFGDSFVTRVITRLDKDTSGLMLLAKNAVVQWKIQKTLNEVERIYEATVEGFLEGNGTISAKILQQTSCAKRIVSDFGKEAITHYEVLENLQNATRIRLKLETGRTHQIRVHMSHIGHPVLGDKLYGSLQIQKNNSQNLKDLQNVNTSQDLHSKPQSKGNLQGSGSLQNLETLQNCPLQLECVKIKVFGKTFTIDD